MTETNSAPPSKPTFVKDLIILFSIPLVIAIVAALIAYLPRILANPQYDFIYSSCDNYRCTGRLQVDSNGKVVAVDDEEQLLRGSRPQLLYYDVSDDSTKVISLAEAQRYELVKSSKSPDGYSLHRSQSNDGFLFWSSYDRSWYLKDGYKQKPINLTADGSYYSSSFNFLGWVAQ